PRPRRARRRGRGRAGAPRGRARRSTKGPDHRGHQPGLGGGTCHVAAFGARTPFGDFHGECRGDPPRRPARRRPGRHRADRRPRCRRGNRPPRGAGEGELRRRPGPPGPARPGPLGRGHPFHRRPRRRPPVPACAPTQARSRDWPRLQAGARYSRKPREIRGRVKARVVGAWVASLGATARTAPYPASPLAIFSFMQSRNWPSIRSETRWMRPRPNCAGLPEILTALWTSIVVPSPVSLIVAVTVIPAVPFPRRSTPWASMTTRPAASSRSTNLPVPL